MRKAFRSFLLILAIFCSLARVSPLANAQATSYTLTTSAITGTSARLNWVGSGPATTFEVRYRKQGEANWINSSDIVATNYPLTDLEPGQPYEWQLLPAGATNWLGGPALFSTVYTCQAIDIVGSSDITATGARLGWFYSYNQPFLVDYRPLNTTAWTTVRFTVPQQYYLTNLTPNTTYQWRVRPLCAAFSTIRQFTTLNCLTTSCSTVVQPTTATLRWQATAGVPYKLRWRQQQGTAWNTIADQRGTYVLDNLIPNTSYEWQVEWACGSTPFTSPLQSFTTACQPPVSVSVVASTAIGVTIGWRDPYQNTGIYAPVSGRYRQQGGAGNWTAIASVPAYSPYPPSPNYDYVASLTGLTPATGYELQLQSTCPDSYSSGYTSPLAFTTGSCLNTATDLYASGPAVNGHWVSWQGVNGGLYAVQHRRVGEVVWRQEGPRDFAGNTTLFIAGLLANTPYEWRVVTYCGTAQSAIPSATLRFTTAPCYTDQISSLRADGYDPDVIGLTWSDAYLPAGNYRVRYRPVGATSFTDIEASSQPVVLTNLPVGAYEWQVAAICDAAASVTYSPASTFTVTCPQPQNALQVLINQGTAVRVGWANRYRNDQSYPRTYQVRYRPTGGTWLTQTITTAAVLPTIDLTGLTIGTTYEWGVGYVCEGSTDIAFVAGDSFTTNCRQMASGLWVGANRVTSVDVRWYNDGVFVEPVTFQVRYRPEGGGWATQAIATTESAVALSLTGLTANSAYTWEVGRVCESTVSPVFTPGTSFTTSCQNMIREVHTVDITVTKANLYYYASVFNFAAPTYLIRYRTVGATTWNSFTTTSTQTSLTGLTPGINYEWQVTTQCAEGFLSDFSPSQFFYTDCSAPANPAATVTANTVSFSWGYNGNVASYTLQYRRQDNTNWQTVEVNAAYGTTLSGLIGAYDWRVRANCSDGGSSPFSVPLSFTTTCDAPDGVAISGQQAYGATVSWVVPTGASRVVLEWRAISAPTWNTVDLVAQSTYMLSGLTNGTGYQVRMQSVCANVQSDFSATTSFGSVCSAPTGLSSVATAFANEPGRTFFWNATAGISYTLRWRLLTTPVSAWHTRTMLSGGTYLMTQFLPGTYEWQLQSQCVDGSLSAFIGGPTFTIPACQTISSYSSVAESTSARLHFGSGAVIELRWRPTGSPGWNVASQLTASLFLLTGLAESTAYEWQVRVLCPNDPALPFGPLQTFTTGCGQPTNLQTSCIRPTEARVSWSGPAGGTYEVSWRPNYGTRVWSTTLITGTQATLSSLTAYTQYEWRVSLACSPTSGTAFSGSSLFYTTCAAPSGLAIARVGSCSYVASWQGCSTEGYTVRVQNGATVTEYTTMSNTQPIGSFQTGFVDVTVTGRCNGNPSETASTYFYAYACETLSPITNPTQYVDGTTATLSWQTTCGSTLLRWRPAGGNWNTVQVNTTTYQLLGLAPDAIYEWQLRSTCTDEAVGFVHTSFFRTRCNVPAIEEAAIDAGSNSIRLGFGSPAVGEVRYRPDGGAWTTVAATTPPMLLTGLTANTRYSIQARSGCSPGDWSPVRFATTACPPPTQLYASPIGEATAQLNWTYNSYFAAAGYERTLRYRPLGAAAWLPVSLTALGTTPPNSYTLTGLSPQTTYEWQVVYECSPNGSSALPGQPITFRTVGSFLCTTMATIQDGNWNETATWSCGRTPIATDAVLIRHRVNVPAGTAGQVMRLRIDAGGLLRYGAGASLITQ